MMSHAQTNLQLFNQLRRQGWGDADLRLVHAAYELAMGLFAGHFRPSHKPFIAHLVGTASVLASCGAEPTVVVAGLLHSVYTHGEFGDGSRGMTDRKRRHVTSAVGPECEALIARYATMAWDGPTVAAMTEYHQVMSSLDAAVALIRLADLDEEHLDLGMQYSPHKTLPRGSVASPDWTDNLVKLAVALGNVHMASQLRHVLDGGETLDVADFLRASRPSSFLVAPKSHAPRLAVRAGKLFRRVRGKLGRFGQHHFRRAA